MTAPMIEWTLEVLEWVRAQVWENWPEAIAALTLPVMTMMMYHLPCGTILPTRALPHRSSRS